MTPIFRWLHHVTILQAVLLPLSLLVPTSQAVPRIASYRMDVRLHPESREIHGSEILTWVNPTEDSTAELWFHLYLNAFKNERSTFLVESKGKHRDETIKAGAWGWIDIDSIRIADGDDLTGSLEFMHPDDDNGDDRTVVRVHLPRSVPPGDSIRLHIDFRAKLHRVFARSGYRRDFFMAAQWFPKIGVFEGEAHGWNCHQYHAHSEYFSDFGTYDVRITVPNRFIVGATGEKIEEIPNADGTKTVRYRQEDIHDFAWTACPDYLVVEEEFVAAEAVSPEEVDSLACLFGLPPEAVRLPDVRMILLVQPSHTDQVARHFEALRNAIKYYGLWYGPYPYRTITMFDPPRGAEDAGGMEYPTFIGAGTRWIQPKDRLSPEGVIVHEFGHQYWYGLVASNEFEEPWLDEGFTTYSTEKVLGVAYGNNHAYKRFTGLEGIPYSGVDWLPIDTHTETFGKINFPLIGIYFEPVPIAPFEGRKRSYLRGPQLDRLNENAWSFYNDDSYWINAYSRPALALRTLENLLGLQTMTRVMRAYHGRFRYGHPRTEDFVETVRDVSGLDFGLFLHQALEESHVFDYAVDRVISDTLSVRRGLYDTPEGRVEIEDGDENEDRRRTLMTEEGFPVIESEVWLRRIGEFVHPVDLLVTYQILLDVDRSNNSRTLEPDRRPVLRWSSRWLLWMQNVLHLAGIFG
jgi:hypothetical protein